MVTKIAWGLSRVVLIGWFSMSFLNSGDGRACDE